MTVSDEILTEDWVDSPEYHVTTLEDVEKAIEQLANMMGSSDGYLHDIEASVRRLSLDIENLPSAVHKAQSITNDMLFIVCVLLGLILWRVW